MSRSKTAICLTPRRPAELLHFVRRIISSIGRRLRSGRIRKEFRRLHKHKFFVPHSSLLWVPSLFLVLGYSFNAIVMGVNGGQMPVQWPGGCANGMQVDGAHVCMTAQTHLKFLGDWIVQHDGVASPGDFFLWAYYYTRLFAITAWVTLLINDCVRVFHAAKVRRRDGRRR